MTALPQWPNPGEHCSLSAKLTVAIPIVIDRDDNSPPGVQPRRQSRRVAIPVVIDRDEHPSRLFWKLRLLTNRKMLAGKLWEQLLHKLNRFFNLIGLDEYQVPRNHPP